MLSVPASFRAMPRWWRDEAGREWLDALPALVTDQCTRWSLQADGDPMHGSNALVVPVRRADEPLALRMAPPGDDIHELATALRLWDGRGTVRLMDADPARNALLMERLDGSRTLTSLPVLEAIEVLAELSSTLAVPVPGDIPTTRGIAASLADELERDWTEAGRPTPRSQLEVAQSLAAELAAVPSDASDTSAVNGDLHFDQVLAGERADWLVVDPVLLRGDREYDIGRVLWSRLDELANDEDVRDAFDLFVRVADVPRDRARSWVVLRSMSYLTWGIPRGLTEDPVRCRRLLDLFV